MDNNEQKNLFWRSDGSSFRTLNETCSRDGKKNQRTSESCMYNCT